MANQTTGNPKVIDTFTGDVTISTNKVQVSSIVMEANLLGDTAVFDDRDGNEVLRLSCETANGSTIWTPSKPFKFNGLTFDNTASSLGAGDFVFIYLV